MQGLRYKICVVIILSLLGVYSDTNEIAAHERDRDTSQDPIENTPHQDDTPNRSNRNPFHTSYRRAEFTDHNMSLDTNIFDSIFSLTKQRWKPQHLKSTYHRQSVCSGLEKRSLVSYFMSRWRLRCRKPKNPNPISSLLSISPLTIEAGSPEFVLTLTGSNFLKRSRVSFNSQRIHPTYLSRTQLEISITAEMIETPGEYPVIIINPRLSGGRSEIQYLTVTQPAQVEPPPEGSFGKRYEDLIPSDATVESYDPKRFSLITGNVKDRSENPIPELMVSIHGHPEYGSTRTDSDGQFSIPVEGGGTMTVVYKKLGFITGHRQVNVPWNDIALTDTITMISEDTLSTTVTFDGNPSTTITHKSSTVTDEHGSRSATMVFRGDNRAFSIDAEGNELALTSITTRATEFDTPESMPARLPPNSAYTYCAELSIDGTNSVRFEKPVPVYVDNFLGFQVGEVVPVGYYDRKRAVWVPAENGVVVMLLDTDNDGAIDALDSTGDNQPDDLNSNGSFRDEVFGLNDPAQYSPHTTYWRFETVHFSPWDCNWPFGPPADAKQPNPHGEATVSQQAEIKDDRDCTSSYVERRSRIFHEDIPIPGTDFALHYASNRVVGYKTDISVPVSGESVPTSLKRIHVTLCLAGRLFEQTLDPLPNQKVDFVWDGLDYLGNVVTGLIIADVKIGFVYDATYYSPGNFAQSFAQAGNDITRIPARQEVVLWKKNSHTIYRAGSRTGTIAEGWTVSAHHTWLPYNPSILYKGDGTTSRNHIQRITTVAGNGQSGYSGDGGPAIEAMFDWVDAIAVDSRGDMYIADSANYRIRKVDANGIVTTVAGNGQCGYSGDGGPATEAELDWVLGLSVDSAGNIYISDQGNVRIRRVDTNGIITTVAGNGQSGYSGDGGPATEAMLNSPRGIAVDSMGNIFIADAYNSRIRKVDANGNITTVAGNGQFGYSGDGGPATEAALSVTSFIAIDSISNIFIADGKRIRKVDASGIITTVAGNGQSGYSGDGGPATEAALGQVLGISVDSIGNFYIGDTYNSRIRKVDTRGIIITVAGNGQFGYSGDGGPATEAKFDGAGRVFVDSIDNIYIADPHNYRIRKVSFPEAFIGPVTAGETAFTDENGLGYIMDSTGLHKSTINLSTDKTLLTFGYNEDKQLISITDRFGNKTTIQRDTSGVPISLTSPDGIVTGLSVDGSNHLIQVTYPDNSNFSFTYKPDGLMTDEYDRNGNHFEHIFDGGGKVTVINDPEGGTWDYLRTVDSDGNITTTVMTGEGNITTYVDRTESTGAFTSVKRDSTGAISSIFRSSDGLSEERELSCGMTLDMKYDLDSEYNYSYLKETLRTSPEGLSQVTTNSRTYEDTNTDDVPDSITDRVTVNGKEWISINNTLTGMITNRSPLGRETTTRYNTTNLLTEEIAFTGLIPTTFSYDTRGKLISTTIGERTTTRAYDENGKIDYVITPNNKILDYTFDIIGRLIQEVRPDGTSIGYEYDTNGNMTLLLTPKNVVHTFDHTGNDQRKRYTTPLSGSYQYVYDKERKLKAVTYPSGKVITNTYTNGLLTNTQTPESIIDYTYGCTSLLSEASMETEKITYTYDGSLLKTDTRSGILNQTIGYTYDNDLRNSSITYAGLTNNLGYDDDGLLTSIDSFTITRNADNGLPETVNDGTLTQTRNFNGYGEINDYSHNVNGSNAYDVSVTRDNTGRIRERTEVIGAETIKWDYVYDDLGKLTEVKKNNSVVESYEYDANGNRTLETNTTRGITDKAFDYTNEDHIVTAGNEVYVFDEDGFLAEKVSTSGTTSYNYSLRGELLSVDLADGRSITYDHDPMGRRIAKWVDGAMVEKYLWADKTTLLAVYDGSDNLLMRFTYADGRLPISMLREGATYYMMYDQVGTLRLIVDSSDNITKRLDYDSFSNIINDTNPGFTIPFGFAGGLHDRDTELVRFGARDYDPTIGRWTAKDPIDFAGGDTNLYGYVLNDPVNFIDPEGKFLQFAPIIVPVAIGSYIFYKWWTSPSHKGARNANDKLGATKSNEECLYMLEEYYDARQKAIHEMGLATELMHNTRPLEGPANSIPWTFVPSPRVPVPIN